MSPSELETYLLNGAQPYEFNRTLKRKIRRRDGKQCVICGETKDLTVAHRKHRNGCNDPRYNDPLNLLLLCDPCHRRFDGDAGPRIHVLHWDPQDKENGLRVGIETDEGGIVTIAKPKIAFYNTES